MILLIWDNETMNSFLEIFKFFHNKSYIYTKKLTHILQPLNISINRTLKDWVKRNMKKQFKVLVLRKHLKLKEKYY